MVLSAAGKIDMPIGAWGKVVDVSLGARFWQHQVLEVCEGVMYVK